MTDYEKAEFERFLIKGGIGVVPANGPRETIRSGSAAGKLLGGNLGCLLKLAGTSYWPDFSDALLFVEAYEITRRACFQRLPSTEVIGCL